MKIIQREISKTPSIPREINKKLKQLLTELCFNKNNSINKSDLIFVYGTPFCINQIASKVISLLNQQIASQVLITGGITQFGEINYQKKSEARLIYENIIANTSTKVDFYLEEKSQNSSEKVIEGLKLVDFRCYKNIHFVICSHGARRGYLTLRKFFPVGQIYQTTYDAIYPGEKHVISKENWHIAESGIKRVWGEFLRIKKYGSRGDIAYEEVEELILKIENTLAN